VTGHCVVAGATTSDTSERPVIGGPAGAFPLDVFPADASYVALGHLHLAQTVDGHSHVRYAGSPIPLALGEASYPHQVAIATFEGPHLVGVESVRVPRAVPILRVPAEAAPLEQVLAALRALEVAGVAEERWPWLEVRVRLRRHEPELRSRIEEALEGKSVRLVKITVERETGEVPGEKAPHRLRELADLDVREVFLRRWALDHEGEPPAELVAAFDEACAAVAAAEAEEP
jgi:exonuclease SbcD